MIRIEPGPVTRLVLARPEKRNALTPQMLDDMLGATRSLPPECGVVTITGEGPAFCSGFDLKLCEDDDNALPALLRGLSDVILALRAIPQPVIVGAHGSVLAGGCAVLGGADHIIASRDASLGYPVLRIGVSPAVSASFVLDQLPSGATRELLLGMTPISADRAAEIGLVHDVVESRELCWEAVAAMAENMLTTSDRALGFTKRWCVGLGNGDRLAADGLRVSIALAGSTEQRTLLEQSRRNQR